MNHQSNNPNLTSSSPNQSSGSNKMPMFEGSKAKLGLLALLVLVVTVLAVVLNHKNKTPINQPTVIIPQAQVSITKNGFNPQTLTVKAGTNVTWTNSDTAANHEVASNPYPKDNSLSSLKSQQLGQNVTYSYRFTQKGTINYHDDLNPVLNGSVVVE